MRLSMKEIADQGFAVRSIRERLADLAAGECGIFEIECEVGEVRARALCNGQRGLLGEDRDDVGIKRAHLDIGGAFAQFQGANDGVGDDAKSDTRIWRRTSAVATG